MRKENEHISLDKFYTEKLNDGKLEMDAHAAWDQFQQIKVPSRF